MALEQAGGQVRGGMAAEFAADIAQTNLRSNPGFCGGMRQRQLGGIFARGVKPGAGVKCGGRGRAGLEDEGLHRGLAVFDRLGENGHLFIEVAPVGGQGAHIEEVAARQGKIGVEFQKMGQVAFRQRRIADLRPQQLGAIGERARKVGAEDERLVEVGQGGVRLVQPPQRAAAIVEGFRETGPRGDGVAGGVGGLGEVVQRAEQGGAVIPGISMGGRECRGAVEAGKRFAGAAQRLQHRAAIAEGVGEAGVDQGRGMIALFGIAKPAHFAQRIGAGIEKIGAARARGQRTVIGGKRAGKVAQRHLRLAEIGQRGCVIGADRKSARDLGSRLRQGGFCWARSTPRRWRASKLSGASRNTSR